MVDAAKAEAAVAILREIRQNPDMVRDLLARAAKDGA